MARQMKDSGIDWIGEIPAEWDLSKIKHHFRVVSGATPKSEKDGYWDGDIPWVTPADYKTQDKYVSHGARYLTKAGYNSCATFLVPAGSIIFSKRAPVGTVAIAKNELCTNQGCLSCVVKENADMTFYYYVMSACTEQFELVSTGTTFKEISLSAFSNFYLPVPALLEQRRIAAFLDDKCARMDSIIEKTRASIDEYKKLKQAIITEAVTKGIRPGHKMKDSGIDWIGEIPEEWKVKRLRYIGKCQNGISKGGEYFGTGFPFVSYSDVYKNMELPVRVQGLVESTIAERKLYSVKRGDIFFTRTSETIEEIGFTAICKETIKDATFAGFLIRVRPFDDNLDVGFSKYYFRSDIHRQFFVKEMNLVIRASLGQELLKKLPVLLPPLPEQQEIAAYLDAKTAAIDRLIAKKEQLVTEMQSCKKSLIYEYVTGKKEAPRSYPSVGERFDGYTGDAKAEEIPATGCVGREMI